jgi:hypothetical protein
MWAPPTSRRFSAGQKAMVLRDVMAIEMKNRVNKLLKFFIIGLSLSTCPFPPPEPAENNVLLNPGY